MTIRCLLRIHNWTMWGEPEREDRTSRTINSATGRIVDQYQFAVLVQRRRCQDCRLVEIREVRS